MAKRIRIDGSETNPWMTPMVRLWTLRILVPLGGHRNFLQAYGFQNDGIASSLGLVPNEDNESKPRHDKCKYFADLRKLHREAERCAGDITSSQTLINNLARLQELVGLTDTDVKILEFAVTIHTSRMLDDAGDSLGSMSMSRLLSSLAILIDTPTADIALALSPKGMLIRSGLLSIDHNSTPLKGKIDLIHPSFADTIGAVDIAPEELLRGLVNPASPPHLELTDYEHIGKHLRLLTPYLKHALTTARTGVNVLLHGAPGTGKTQLAGILARELGAQLFEVASEDSLGKVIDAEARFRAYRAAQYFFCGRKAMLLFDEIEDVFNDGDILFGRKSTAQTRKAWVNRTLEENPLPAFWLSNSLRLDAAFIRRFDMIIELPIPPRRQRLRIAQSVCSDFRLEPAIARLADCDSLAPAVLTRAASVIRCLQADLGARGSADAVEQLVNATLKAQGHRPTTQDNSSRLPEVYDPAFLQVDCDLAEVAQGLLRSHAGRLCLYGPPGTGKTAFGRWVAQQLDAPLLVRRASDLVSMWVGQTEKNIADAFEQATRDEAVLLIDEVDSFLQDRRGAQRSWEVTQVNEMLTQMESFAGVFIASTNLMAGLDQASLRRFDLKVKFDYLTSVQATELFQRHARSLGIPAAGSEELPHLRRLRTLTPGDFAAVIRQHRFRPITSAMALVGALEGECAVKEPSSRPIGFAA